jgi:hypothetical protein
MCVKSCDNVSESKVNQTFNGIVYNYCVSPAINTTNTSNNSNYPNNTSPVNETSVIKIIGCR